MRYTAQTTWSMLRSGATWLTLLSLGWLLAKWRRIKPRSLLDNAPLAELLQVGWCRWSDYQN
jgi:hypothetical protein